MPSVARIEFRHRYYRAQSWADAKKRFDRLPLAWVFRGQRESNWSLLPALERLVLEDPRGEPSMIPYYEDQFLSQFMNVAPHYLAPNVVPRDRLEWLALMQHHGAPTRLLDWTFSPYVAAFFALEHAKRDAAVWAVGVTKLNEAISSILGLPIFPLATVESTNSPIYYERVLAARLPGVYVVQPQLLNQRLYIQQGTFMIGGDPAKTFSSNLIEMAGFESSRYVVRIELPLEIRGDALRDLHRMNITRASLFPGLDGFAASFQNHIDKARLPGMMPLFQSVLNELDEDFGEVYEPTPTEQ